VLATFESDKAFHHLSQPPCNRQDLRMKVRSPWEDHLSTAAPYMLPNIISLSFPVLIGTDCSGKLQQVSWRVRARSARVFCRVLYYESTDQEIRADNLRSLAYSSVPEATGQVTSIVGRILPVMRG